VLLAAEIRSAETRVSIFPALFKVSSGVSNTQIRLKPSAVCLHQQGGRLTRTGHTLVEMY